MNRKELADKHSDDLGFTPQDAVRWLSPGELARTGLKVALSAVFAEYADKREIQGSLGSTLLRAPLLDPDTTQEVWVDFTADVGDGFDATYSVATMLAAGSLQVRLPSGEQSHPLPRGCLLVLGGDEVYPTASADNYNNRMVHPYRAALPEASDQPLLVALPGNHDWYDGLSSFLRIFTHGRPIGGWQTQQRRSYFAVQLPHRWWLLGLDSQFGTYIDEPQLAFFREHVSKNLKQGDGIILCSAAPTWVKSVEKDDPDAFNQLHWFDRNLVRVKPKEDGSDGVLPTGASVRLWITGDTHHYARYAGRLPGEQGDLGPEPARRQLVTCGLGGAYLMATHHLPDTLPLPSDHSRMREKDAPQIYSRVEARYPSKDDSSTMASRLAKPWKRQWLPRRNPGMFQLVGGLHVLVFLILAALVALTSRIGFMAVLRETSVETAVVYLGRVLGLLALAVAALLVARSWRSRSVAWLTGTATRIVLPQLLVALVILFTVLSVGGWQDWSNFWVLLVTLVSVGVVGSALGNLALGLSIVWAGPGAVRGWQTSGQSEEDGKGFIRMRIAPDGTLTLYPIVVDEVCHDWSLVPGADGGVRPEPETVLDPRLIEEPVTIAREVPQK